MTVINKKGESSEQLRSWANEVGEKAFPALRGGVQAYLKEISRLPEVFIGICIYVVVEPFSDRPKSNNGDFTVSYQIMNSLVLDIIILKYFIW